MHRAMAAALHDAVQKITGSRFARGPMIVLETARAGPAPCWIRTARREALADVVADRGPGDGVRVERPRFDVVFLRQPISDSTVGIDVFYGAADRVVAASRLTLPAALQ